MALHLTVTGMLQLPVACLHLACIAPTCHAPCISIDRQKADRMANDVVVMLLQQVCPMLQMSCSLPHDDLAQLIHVGQPAFDEPAALCKLPDSF